MTEMATGYTIVGREGIYHGHSRQRYPHTIAAEQIEYRELRRDPSGSVWDVEGFNGHDDRSGPYRLSIGELHALPEQQRADYSVLH
jgi:hypothetical protein